MSMTKAENLIHGYMGSLRHGGKYLSPEAYFFYSRCYSTHQLFFHRFPAGITEVFRKPDYPKSAFNAAIRELENFSLVRTCHEATGKAEEGSDVRYIELLPPPPLVLMRGRLRSADAGKRSLLVEDILTLGDDEFAPFLRNHILHMTPDGYERASREFIIGEDIYFVAEVLQKEDGTWELKNEFNIMKRKNGIL